MKKLFVLLALTACGGDDAPTDPPFDPAIVTHIDLTAPADLAPGELVPVAWTISDAAPDSRLELRLIAPGDPLVPTTAGYQFTGSVPATLYAGSIGADGSLTEAVVGLPATSGQLMLALPTSQEGDWRIEAFVRRGETLVAFASATTWVAAQGIRLDVNRSWAGSDDVVRIDVRARPSAEPLRLSAWLTLPDGSVTSLPGINDQYIPVLEGMLPESLPPLLFQRLGAHGSGRYIVSARLETLAGEPRGSAATELQICDEPATITGTLSGGAGARISAFTLVDRETAATDATSDGAFTLAVPAGTWFLHGDGAGTSVEVGCGATANVALDTAARRTTPAQPGPRANQADQPRVLFHVVPDLTVPDPESAELLAENLSGEMHALRIAGFEAVTTGDIERLFGFARGQMLMGTQTQLLDLSQVSEAPDYVVTLVLKPLGSELVMNVSLIHVKTVTGVRSAFVKAPDIESMIAQIPSIAATLLANPDSLRERIDITENPLLNAFWRVNNAAPGDMVTGIIHVTDDDAGRVLSGIILETEITTEDGSVLVGGGGTTDGQGQVETFAFTIPANVTGSIKLGAKLRRKDGTEVKAAPAVLVIQPPQSAMRLEKQVLKTGGDRAATTVELPEAANRVAMATATTVTVDGPSEVRFDDAGRARFDVVTDSRDGPAEIAIATAPQLLGPTAPRVTARAYVVKPLTLGAFVEPSDRAISGQILEIRAVVALDGIPVPNLPVAITMLGDGQVTPSAMTSSTGRFSVFWRAPLSAQPGETVIELRVVKDTNVVEQSITLRYEPPCTSCPLQILPGTGAAVERKGSLLLTANQPVTWTSSRGTITPDGLYTAPDLGGNAVITATSVADPSKTAKVGVIEECTLDEIVDEFTVYTGDVTPLAPWRSVYDASCLKVSVSLFDIGASVQAGVFEHRQACGNGFGLSGGVIGISLASCTAALTEFAPCGQIASLALSPDLDSDGLKRRRYFSSLGRNVGTGSCVMDYVASGFVEK